MAGGRILLIGADLEVQSLLKSLPEGPLLQQMETFEELEDSFEKFNDGQFYLIIMGSKIADDQALEAGQFLQFQCPATPLYFIVKSKERLAIKKFVKNGYKNVFLIPMDKDLLIRAIQENVSDEKLYKRSYRPIKVMDIQSETQLGFDTYIYLPLNGKYIKYTRADAKIPTEKVEKLSKHSVSNIHVDQKDMDKFYEYTASILIAANGGKGNEMSATEREEVLQGSVRKLFVNLLDTSENAGYDEGKVFLNVCQNIVSKYITNGRSNSWYKDLVRAIGTGTNGYNRASSISTIASLFAIGIGLQTVGDVAIAGFLCDISLADVPEDILEKDINEWPEDFKKIYETHPQTSVNIIKEKKMVLSPVCEKAILQHHEEFSGKGFPRKMSGHKISQEAQIIMLAERFFDLTSTRPGHKTYPPLEALDIIFKSAAVDFELVSKAKKLIPKAA